MNAIRNANKLARGSPLAQCEPVTLLAPPDSQHLQAQALRSTVQNTIQTARPSLSDTEFQEFENLVTEYKDIFAVDNEDYGRTNHREDCSGRTGRDEQHA